MVRNLGLGAAVGVAALLTRLAGVWNEHSGWIAAALYPALSMGLGAGVSLAGMLYYSRIGKIRLRERLLDQLRWNGNETALDVGCGRGLMLIGAALRTPGGLATGIDIWNNADLGANAPSHTLDNARIEGVAARVRVISGDARAIPLADQSVDVAVSNAALHNIGDAAGRARAIAEIARVLKPGGQALIGDLRFLEEYARTFAAHGCAALVRRSAMGLIVTAATWGLLRPGTVLASKPAVG